jgi:hypothetical protein
MVPTQNFDKHDERLSYLIPFNTHSILKPHHDFRSYCDVMLYPAPGIDVVSQQRGYRLAIGRAVPRETVWGSSDTIVSS